MNEQRDDLPFDAAFEEADALERESAFESESALERETAVERLVSRYLDGTLEASERARFEDSLAVDGEARRLLEEGLHLDRIASEALRGALGSSCPLAAMPPVESPAPGRGRWPFVLRLAAAVLVALLCWGSWMIWRQPEPELSGSGKTESPDRSAIDKYVRPDSAIGHQMAEAVKRGTEWKPGVPLDREVPGQFIEGESRGERVSQSRIITVFDEQNEELHLFEIDQVRTRVQPVGLDL